MALPADGQHCGIVETQSSTDMAFAIIVYRISAVRVERILL
jgi:hypothetical protein